MSEQNYAETILVSAFQDEFLLEILARLHISKVQNTEHTGSDFILKVQNSNSKRTEVFEGPKLHSEADYCPELHFEADYCPKLYFKADQFNLKLHFEADHCPELYFEADY
ncbi:hypothetical protein RclHR1_18290002 [Rhizophagus clarus]|uniref:Uncharacterized protein n=1 Tax=Rhizophagus clarus TaxID=94130 RepID=A0A2Z6QZE4_9GLOM|nr:hypothetical protein RclHR1_18290002 [Rhizophagus clarus]